MNGCILKIYLDFSHNFKTTDRLNWFKISHKLCKLIYGINVKKGKIFKFSTTMSLFTNRCNLIKTIFSFPNRAIIFLSKQMYSIIITQHFTKPFKEAYKAFQQQHNTILAQNPDIWGTFANWRAPQIDELPMTTMEINNLR